VGSIFSLSCDYLMIKTFLFLINNKWKCFSGKKLLEYPAKEEEVLLLEKRVSEAKRLAVAVTVKFCIELSCFRLLLVFLSVFVSKYLIKLGDFVGIEIGCPFIYQP
jgi:hypothetical protein